MFLYRTEGKGFTAVCLVSWLFNKAGYNGNVEDRTWEMRGLGQPIKGSLLGQIISEFVARRGQQVSNYTCCDICTNQTIATKSQKTSIERVTNTGKVGVNKDKVKVVQITIL